MIIITGLLLIIIGIIAGGYGAIVGAGGGFIFVPALLLLFHVEPTIAAGTGLVIVLMNSLSGVVGYSKQKRIDYRTGILLSIGAFPGSFLGVWLLQMYASSSFYILFASLLVILGVFLIVKNTRVEKKSGLQDSKNVSNQVAATTEQSHSENSKPLADEPKSRLLAKYLLPLGLIMGIFSSYLGIGGGWLLVPILIYIFRMPTHNATATSIFSLCLYTSVGVILQIINGNVDWSYVLYGGLGIVVGSQLGVRLSQKIPSRVIMQMLSVLLIVIGFRMYFQ